jgi:hypothetical protein
MLEYEDWAEDAMVDTATTLKGQKGGHSEMTQYTRREIRKLKPEIRTLIEKAANQGDAQAFIRWLQKYGNHLSFERQAQIIAQFKQMVADESARGRRNR